MIKNRLAAAAAVLALVAAASCKSRSPGPEGYQGVVELEERHLGFELGGRLLERPVDRGQAIEAGMVLAKLDESLAQPVRDARAAELKAAQAQLDLILAGSRNEDVRAAAAQLRSANAREEKLGQALSRARKLAAGGAEGQATVDDLERDVAGALAEANVLEEKLRSLRAGARPQEIDLAYAKVAQAKAALAAEDERLVQHVLKADAKTTVLDVHVEPGEIVAAGVPVVTVADLTHPYVDVFVAQQDLAGIKLGAPATARVDADRETFKGKVEDIGRELEFTPRYIFSPRERPNLVARVRIRLEDPQQRLHAGAPAFVTLP